MFSQMFNRGAMSPLMQQLMGRQLPQSFGHVGDFFRSLHGGGQPQPPADRSPITPPLPIPPPGQWGGRDTNPIPLGTSDHSPMLPPSRGGWGGVDANPILGGPADHSPMIPPQFGPRPVPQPMPPVSATGKSNPGSFGGSTTNGFQQPQGGSPWGNSSY